MGLLDEIVEESEREVRSSAVMDDISSDATDMEWRDVALSAAKNIIPSSWQYLKDITYPVRHPIQTATGVGSMMKGRSMDLSGLEGLEIGGKTITAEDIGQKPTGADALVDMLKERYGTIDNLKQTIAKDPMGFAADISSLLTGVGHTGKIGAVGRMAKEPSMIGKTLGGVQKIGEAVEPLKAASKATGPAARRMWAGAAKLPGVKPPKGWLATKWKRKLHDTALQQGIVPGPEGLDKLTDKLSGMDTRIDEILTKEVSGDLLSADRLLEGLDDILSDAKFSIDPKANRRAIDRVKTSFMEEWYDKTHYWDDDVGDWVEAPIEEWAPKQMTPAEVQRKKVRTYKEIESHYKQKPGATPAKVEAAKKIAFNAKEYLGEIAPEIKKLNADYGPMRDLQTAIDRAYAQRIGQRDLIGIGMPIKGGAGYAIGESISPGGGPIGAGAGIALGILDTPSVKSRVAILLHKMSKDGIITNNRKLQILNKVQQMMVKGAPDVMFQTGRLTRKMEETPPDAKVKIKRRTPEGDIIVIDEKPYSEAAKELEAKKQMWNNIMRELK